MHHIFLDIYVDIYVTHDIYVTYMLFFICDIYDCSIWAHPWHDCNTKAKPSWSHCSNNPHSYSPFPPSRTLFSVIWSISDSHGGLLKLPGAGFISSSDCTASKSSSCLTRTFQCSCSITTDSQSDKSLL